MFAAIISMQPIKVLHFVSVDKENYYLRNLATFSDPAEGEHSFVTSAAAECEFVVDMRNSGFTVLALEKPSRYSYPRLYSHFVRHLKREAPDVVHTHLFDPSLIGLTAAKRRNIRTVLTRHHSDAVHMIRSRIKRQFYLALESYISRKSDHIVAPSRTVRDFLLKEGVPAEKVSVIPYGQTTERFDAVTDDAVAAVRRELGMGDGLKLVCNSRLFHRKGHIFLFEALVEIFAERPNAMLYLVGSGDQQASLEAKAKEFGIDKQVRFLGWRSDALAIMKAADVIVHPSLEDALSSAVIEAIMLGKPIVATDISGVRDTLDNGKYGEIVRPGDSASLCTGMEKTLANLETSIKRAQKGRDYLLQYMDAHGVAQEYSLIYTKLVRGN